MAYRSLRTLAQAILPYKTELVKIRHIQVDFCPTQDCSWPKPTNLTSTLSFLNKQFDRSTMEQKRKRRSVPSCRGHPRWDICNLLSGPKTAHRVWEGSHRCPYLCLQKTKEHLMRCFAEYIWLMCDAASHGSGERHWVIKLKLFSMSAQRPNRFWTDELSLLSFQRLVRIFRLMYVFYRHHFSKV